MNYLFTICGRAGSKGLANKNISYFNNIPLVFYTLSTIDIVSNQLMKEGNEIHFVVNTDSDKLVEIIKSQKKVNFVHIPRTDELAGDRVAKVSVILDTLKKAEMVYNCTFDYVIDLDITSPLRTAQDVINAINKKKEREDTDVVYSLAPARKNPYFNQAKLVNGYYEKVIHADFVSRQDTPVVYDMNASIYVYEPRALREKEPSRFFNDKADAIIMKDTGILDIDCNEDKEMMEILARYYFFERYEDYKEIYEHAKSMME